MASSDKTVINADGRHSILRQGGRWEARKNDFFCCAAVGRGSMQYRHEETMRRPADISWLIAKGIFHPGALAAPSDLGRSPLATGLMSHGIDENRKAA